MVEAQLKEIDDMLLESAVEKAGKKPAKFEIIADSAPQINTGELVGQLLSVTFSMIALKAGKHWELTPEEAATAGEAYGDVLDKYFPDLGNNLGVESTAIMVTGMLVVPRLMQNAPKAEAVKANAKAETRGEVIAGNFGLNEEDNKDGD